MRRNALVLFVLVTIVAVACRREGAPNAAVNADREPSEATEPSRVSMAPRRACTGDGSYEKAVDCFRKANALKFTSPEGMGTLTRDERGRERLVLLMAKGPEKGNWFAEEQSTGVVWSLDGKKANAVPARLEKLYQRVTIFPDPQKKEGKPALTSRDDKAIVYEFSDANNGEKYVVKVDPRLGAIRAFQIGDLDLDFGSDAAAPPGAKSPASAASPVTGTTNTAAK